MRTFVAGTVCAVLLGVASLAQAGQLLSPPYSVKTAYACVATAGALANFRGGLVFHKHVLDNLGILVLHPIRFAPLR